jgi:hypothetical protein
MTKNALIIKRMDLHRQAAILGGKAAQPAILLLLYSLIQTYRYGITDYKILLIGSIIAIIASFVSCIHIAQAARHEIDKRFTYRTGKGIFIFRLFLALFKDILLALAFVLNTAVFFFNVYVIFYLGIYNIIITIITDFTSATTGNLVFNSIIESIFYIIVSWLILDKIAKLQMLSANIVTGEFKIIDE